jgi:hypothetical protein
MAIRRRLYDDDDDEDDFISPEEIKSTLIFT